MKFYVIAFFSALWFVEIGVVGAATYAALEGHNAWPLIALAVGFGLAMPFPHKAAKAEL